MTVGGVVLAGLFLLLSSVALGVWVSTPEDLAGSAGERPAVRVA